MSRPDSENPFETEKNRATSNDEIVGPADASGEVEAGNRGSRSGINQRQNRAVGQDDPLAEGSRQGRERYRSNPDESNAERENIPPV